MKTLTRTEVAIVKPELAFSGSAVGFAAPFMKAKKLLLISFIACHTIASAEAQGTFQNLDFESAWLVPSSEVTYPSVEFASAFPGWVGYIGGVQRS